MQFCSSAVQIVGRLFGMWTTASGGAAGALTGTGAFGATTLTLTLASALALALAAAAVLAAVCFCSLSSFSSISRSCFFSTAISASVELADCALTCDPTNVMTIASAIFVLRVAKGIEAPSLQLGFELHRKKQIFVHARNDRRRPATTMG